tara:strand:+ start:74 stop:265 length:192 start_codon:yes stop_codon:yes gene_type:complete
MTENDYRETTLTHSQAIYQLEQHGVLEQNGVIDVEEFHAALGKRETYTGAEFLDWLGGDLLLD